MKMVRKYNDINDFEINYDIIIISKGNLFNRSLYALAFNKVTIIVSNQIIPNFRVIDSELFAYCKGKTVVYNLNEEYSEKIQYENFYPKFRSADLIIGDQVVDEDRSLIAFIEKSMIKKWSINYTSTISACFNDILLLVKFEQSNLKLCLHCFSLASGNLLWEFDISNGKYDHYNVSSVYKSDRERIIKAEIKAILGIFKKVVYISLNSGAIVGIDVNSGIEVEYFNQPFCHPFENGSSDTQIFTTELLSKLDDSTGTILGLNGRFFGEINLNVGHEGYMVYQLIDVDNSSHYEELRFGDLFKNEILFYKWSFAQDDSFVGIFDLNQRKIIWTSLQLGSDGIFKGVTKIRYDGKRLFVLDRANTLHVLEKD